jgi:hypothetical protein
MGIILESDRLKVEIAEPGVVPNTSTRFDRAGFVTQVTLDGRHQFCSREPDNLPHASTGGAGLCNEFRFGEPSLEAPMGTQFPKFGVGLLTKDLDGRYVFHHKYRCDPFPISVDARESIALFDTAPVECMGYAVHGTKKLDVAANELTMTMTVENVGQRPIAFEEYCHNFVTIDRLPIGPDYCLGMPVSNQDGKPANSGVALVGKGHGVGFSCYSNAPSFFVIDASDVTCEAPFTWKLSHANTTASISETVSVLPARIMVWTIDHIISPEIGCHFELAPGESTSWTRRWAFDD